MIEYWGFTQISEATGQPSGTLRKWHQRGKLPAPDAMVGAYPGWLPPTIRAWWAATPE